MPDSLRNEALTALRSGTPASEVRRACGVTSDQLAQWRKHQEAGAPVRDLVGPEPRVFSVVDDMDDMVDLGIAPTRRDAHQELELHIGGWAICIRQIEA
jgi:hypothetical protein